MWSALRTPAFCLALCLGAAGCRHKRAPVPVPVAAQAPVVIETTPEPQAPPLVQTVPLQPTPLPTVSAPVKKAKKVRKKTATPPPVVPPQTVAAVEPAPEGDAIGALTTGGEATPEKSQKAAELIAELEKRLAALAPALAGQDKPALERVRYFKNEAQKALKSGDADGAVTLATKAKVLLDELEK